MATTAGAITVLSQSTNSAVLQSAPATGGAAPYTYQWHRSTVTGFTPAGGTALAGKTDLILQDSGLIPNTTYYYKLVSTDSGSVAATSTQSTVVTQPGSVVPMNQFGQTVLAGMTDLKLNYDTVSVMLDSTQSVNLYPGMPVKMVDSAGGVPKVVGCTASTDEVLGFINYDARHQFFKAGDACEISMAGNCMYMYATTAIARQSQVTLEVGAVGTSAAGVSQAVASSGKCIVGFAYDKAVNPGELIRIIIRTPSFKVA